MSDGLRERLIAATTKWRDLNGQRKQARDEVFDVAAEMLKAGVAPPEVVALTPFSDALVRSEARKRGAPEARRGPKRNEESKSASDTPSGIARPTTTPFKVPALAPSRAPIALSREEDLLAIARALTEDDQARIADALFDKHRQFLGRNTSPMDTIERAIRANLASASDLR